MGIERQGFWSARQLLSNGYSAGDGGYRAQDLVDVDALRESALDQIKREGREEWLKQREQKGSSPTLEEIRAQGREDWLKLRNQPTPENSRDPQNRSAKGEQEAKSKDLSESPDKGLDDDLE